MLPATLALPGCPVTAGGSRDTVATLAKRVEMLEIELDLARKTIVAIENAIGRGGMTEAEFFDRLAEVAKPQTRPQREVLP